VDTEEPILTLDEFLSKKRDYSPFLVHLTKDDKYPLGNDEQDLMPAEEILYCILDEHKLKAFNHFCYFSKDLDKEQNISIKDKFKVVCFTETPIDQIDILFDKVISRKFNPKPYGLVFRKEYIRTQGGNPVLYLTKEIAKPLWGLYPSTPKLLALVSVCEKGNDFHWEREWRIVGDFSFQHNDVFCGLCPEEEIKYFEDKFPIIFIKLVGYKSEVDDG
jgi:hypothetical protein